MPFGSCLVISNPLTIFSIFFRSLAGVVVDAAFKTAGGARSALDIGLLSSRAGKLGKMTGGEDLIRCALNGEGFGLTVSKADELLLPTIEEELDEAAAAAAAAAAATATDAGVTGEFELKVYGAKRCALKRSLLLARDEVAECTEFVDVVAEFDPPEAAAAAARVAALRF